MYSGGMAVDTSVSFARYQWGEKTVAVVGVAFCRNLTSLKSLMVCQWVQVMLRF